LKDVFEHKYSEPITTLDEQRNLPKTNRKISLYNPMLIFFSGICGNNTKP
jgi:hypothetical protein